MLFRAFGFILGGRKSLKMKTFSQHDKSDLDMLYAVFASIQGGSEIDKNRIRKNDKILKIQACNKTPKK